MLRMIASQKHCELTVCRLSYSNTSAHDLYSLKFNTSVYFLTLVHCKYHSLV